MQVFKCGITHKLMQQDRMLYHILMQAADLKLNHKISSILANFKSNSMGWYKIR